MTREPDLDVIIIGAGISGMYQLHLLRQLGLRVQVFEAGSGVGGVWYWNRYPGARFDSESYSYGYSFSAEMLAEWDWTEHFAPQPETERYLNLFADKYDLRRDIRFGCRVAACHWDEATGSWTVRLEGGEERSCRFLITAVGPLSAPTMPKFAGIDDFRGESWHTGLWPKHEVSFAGKWVAVIGTGASGVQAISEIARTAGHLTVFQRRPNWCTPLHNGPITPEEMEDIRARYDEIFARCARSATCFIHDFDRRRALDLDAETRNAVWEQKYNAPGFDIWMGNFRDVYVDARANRLLSDFVAAKIRARVKDPETAEMLIPKDHGFGTRRVPQESGYYEVYNQPNVRLVSMLKTPVVRITPNGLETTGESFDFDMIVYATGFDAVTGSLDRIDIRGTGGQRLRDRWADGPETYLGILADGFPNMFMLVGPHAALGNIPRSIEHCVEWVTGLVGHLTGNGLVRAEVPPEAVAEWMAVVAKKAEGQLANEVDSWMTGVNLNVEGKQVRRLYRYSGPAPEFRELCSRIAEAGYRELRLA